MKKIISMILALTTAASLAVTAFAQTKDNDSSNPVTNDTVFFDKDADDLELYLIDHGLEEFGESTGEKDEPQLVARCAFEDFGTLQKALEDRGITPISAEHEYICQAATELPEEQATEVLELIDKLEQEKGE